MPCLIVLLLQGVELRQSVHRSITPAGRLGLQAVDTHFPVRQHSLLAWFDCKQHKKGRTIDRHQHKCNTTETDMPGLGRVRGSSLRLTLTFLPGASSSIWARHPAKSLPVPALTCQQGLLWVRPSAGALWLMWSRIWPLPPPAPAAGAARYESHPTWTMMQQGSQCSLCERAALSSPADVLCKVGTEALQK